MSQATDIAVDPALANLKPGCDVGHQIGDPSHQCAERATWAIRTHDHQGECPLVSLLCDQHLSMVAMTMRKYWKQFAKNRRKHPKCTGCNTEVRRFEDLLWGIERIAP